MSDDPAFYLAATAQVVEGMRDLTSGLVIRPLSALLPASKGIVVAPSQKRWIQYKPVPNNVNAIDWFLKCNVLSRHKNYVSVFWKVKKPLIRYHMVLEFRFEGSKVDILFWLARGSSSLGKIYLYYDGVNPGWHVYGMVQVAFGERRSKNAPYHLAHVRFDISDHSSYDHAVIRCCRMASILMDHSLGDTVSRALNGWCPLVVRPDGTLFESGYNTINWPA